MLNAMAQGSNQNGTIAYELWVRGEVGGTLAADLGARSIELADARTRIVVDVIDQSHLHGVLERLRDLNLEIERVNPV